MLLPRWVIPRETVTLAQRIPGVLGHGALMETVVIFGWSGGFQKVEFTKLLRHELGFSLSEAKSKTDAVLQNQRIELRLHKAEVDQVLVKLNQLGAKFVREAQE
jgi:ribosomal protein L7/L12